MKTRAGGKAKIASKVTEATQTDLNFENKGTWKG